MSARPLTRRAVLAALGGAALPSPAFAQQGFAGLGQDAQGFAPVTPGRAVRFPEDLGPHPGFRIEWWYLTANLRGPDGARYGAQWTLFRQRIAPGRGGQDGAGQGWDSPQVWMGHAALTGADTHRFAERLGRGGIGQAGARADPFAAWIDGWRLEAGADGWTVQAAGPDFACALSLAPNGPFVPHGDGGYSVKSEAGQASYYYSQPFLTAEGALTLDGAEIPVTGQAWLDREWSSRPLAAEQEGWDWLSLHLEGGARLMVFRLREGGGDAFFSGTWIAPDGAAAPLRGEDIALTPLRRARVAGRRLPVRWRLRVPARGLDVEIAPLNAQAWNGGLIPYWEGPVFAEGSHPAEGYLEMTGY